MIKYFCFQVKRIVVKVFGLSQSDFLYELKIRAAHVGGGTKTFSKCYVNKKTEIGNNTILNGIRIIGSGKCEIGSYCHIAYGVTIITMNHNYQGDGIPYDDTDIEKPVYIGDFVWIGANVTVLPGVKIGEGAIIQAGSVVRKDIPDLAIAGGNPAVPFKYRDKEHYYKMKTEGKWF